MKEFLRGKWGKVAIVALFLCLGLGLGAVFSDNPSINDNTPKPSDGETMQSQMQTTIQRVTEPPTQAPTQSVTEPPTQAQTKKFTIFVYGGELTDLGTDVDTSKLVENCLYLSNLETNTLTKLTEPVLQYHVSESRIDYIYNWEADRVYYVLDSEPTRVYCIDLFNEAQNLVYESQNGYVMFVDWYNKEEQDKLILIEDAKRVVMRDLITDETELLMEQYYVWRVTYTPDSLDYGGEDKGPTLKWAGAVSADDTWERGYVYHILTGENWKATWG